MASKTYRITVDIRDDNQELDESDVIAMIMASEPLHKMDKYGNNIQYDLSIKLISLHVNED